MLAIGWKTDWESSLDNYHAKQKSVCVKKISIIIGGLLIILFCVLWFKSGRNRFLEKEKNAQIFIDHIVISVLKDTVFYKENSDENTIMVLQNNRNAMSDNYTISTIDYSWGIYECEVKFDGKTSFSAKVTFRENKPFLKHFSFKPPAWEISDDITDNEIARIAKDSSLHVLRSEPTPQLYFANLRSVKENADIYLTVIIGDIDNDILGIGIKVKYFGANGSKVVKEETYPVFIHKSFPDISTHFFKVTIRNEDLVKDLDLWRQYVDGRLKDTPPIILSIPEPDKVEVWLWVYDKAGNKSDLLKVDSLVATNWNKRNQEN